MTIVNSGCEPCQSSHGPFTLTKTETDTKTGPDKMATVLNGFGVLVQYEDLHTILYKPFLPAATKLGQGYPPPRPGTPPGARYTPRPGTPPGTRYTPRDQVHPPPLPPPRELCMLGNTGNKRAVRILLECILVISLSIVLGNSQCEHSLTNANTPAKKSLVILCDGWKIRTGKSLFIIAFLP